MQVFQRFNHQFGYDVTYVVFIWKSAAPPSRLVIPLLYYHFMIILYSSHQSIIILPSSYINLIILSSFYHRCNFYHHCAMVSSLQCTSSHHFTNVLPSATIILTSFCHHPTITIITHCCVPISYLGVTIGSYHKHEVEPYDNAKELRKVRMCGLTIDPLWFNWLFKSCCHYAIFLIV